MIDEIISIIDKRIESIKAEARYEDSDLGFPTVSIKLGQWGEIRKYIRYLEDQIIKIEAEKDREIARLKKTIGSNDDDLSIKY